MELIKIVDLFNEYHKPWREYTIKDHKETVVWIGKDGREHVCKSLQELRQSLREGEE